MNYYGDAAAGNDQRSAGGSSSRKGKKGNSDKPKQPQRGLGVAQLEKIRLHSQLGFHPTNLHPQEDIRIQTATYSPSSSFSYTSSSSTNYNTSCGQQNFMIGMGEPERSNMIYDHSQPSSDPRWNTSNGMLEAQYYAEAGITRHLFQVEVEDTLKKEKRNDFLGSSGHNSDSNGSQELDLELRLSL